MIWWIIISFFSNKLSIKFNWDRLSKNFWKIRRNIEKLFVLLTSLFTKERSFYFSLTSIFRKHVKDDISISNDISIVWSNINDLCDESLSLQTMSDQSKSSKNALLNFDLTSKQMHILLNNISTTVNTKINRLENELRQLLQFQFFYQKQSSSFQNSKNNIEKIKSSKNRIVKKVEFFDLTIDELKSIVNLSKYVFYKNVYVFVNRLKNVDWIREKNRLK